MIYGSFSIKNEIVLLISLSFLVISIYTQIVDFNNSKEDYNVSYEYVNIKDMAQAKVVEKTPSNDNGILASISNTINETFGQVEEVSMEQPDNTPVKKIEPIPLEPLRNSEAVTPRRSFWRLPIEQGTISTYPHFGHVAYDMYSTRGVRETIHPIANGTVSNIYTDAAGALIVTVYHYLYGRQFTSQYVHLSSYAPGLHVGQDVTINDSLGQMGSTGYSTGVHLHIAVLDCALNERTDPNCYDLNAWTRYGRKRLAEGFYGLSSLVIVPNSWYNFNE